MNRRKPAAMPQSLIDTTYQTQQRDMFNSGLAGQIGANAFTVWHAIKSHADFETGESYPGVRRLTEMTGVSHVTVMKAISILKDERLLRIARVEGQRHIYIARERMDVRIGTRVICTIVIDYVPNTMRERLAELRASTTGEGDLEGHDVWADVEIIPGQGFELDMVNKIIRGRLRADEVPPPEDEAPPSLPSLSPVGKLELDRARAAVKKSQEPPPGLFHNDD